MRKLIPNSPSRRVDRKRCRVRPALEALEVRQVPTSSLLATAVFYPPNPCVPSHSAGVLIFYNPGPI